MNSPTANPTPFAVVISTVAVRLIGQWSYLFISAGLFTGVCCGHCQSSGQLPTFAPFHLLPYKFLAHLPGKFVCQLKSQMTERVLFCVTLKAMKMSRRSADASQRALAYSRMVDGLNEFRLGNNTDIHSTWCRQRTYLCVCVYCFSLEQT